MSAVIKGADQLRRKLRGLAERVLPDLEAPLKTVASEVRNAADASAPNATGALLASSFVDGAEVNAHALSATATAGYEAEHAPYVHEGVHGPFHTTPPKWLELAAEPFETVLASAIGDAIEQSLEKQKE